MTNRRNFIMESLTGFLGCSGMAMFAISRGISRGPKKEEETRYVESGSEVWIWKRVSNDKKHSWSELLDTIVYPDGTIYTRTYGSADFFKRAKITLDFYPLCRPGVVNSFDGKETYECWCPVHIWQSVESPDRVMILAPKA